MKYATYLRRPRFETLVRSAESELAPHLLEGHYGSCGTVSSVWVDVFNGFMKSIERVSDASDCSEAVSVSSAFLAGIYECARNGESQRGSVTIMQHLDGLLHAGKTAECNALLESVEVEDLPVRMVLAFSTITNLVPGGELPAKKDFTYRARRRLTRELGQQRTFSILGTD